MGKGICRIGELEIQLSEHFFGTKLGQWRGLTMRQHKNRVANLSAVCGFAS